MQIARIGLDLAKYVFEIHGVDAHGKTVLRQIIRHQQTWRSLSAHLADPWRSSGARTGSRKAGSEKLVARQDAAAATPQHRRRRARQQECADCLELAHHQRQRL
jgi:hypothetical protein